MNSAVVLVAVILLTTSVTVAEFTEHFNDFLITKYNKYVQKKLERLDYSVEASFGGRTSASDTVVKRPVIFVHGISSTAGFFRGHREFFLLKGYKSSELYATTYGEGIRTKTFHEKIQCSFIRQIRRMIIAVHEYTHKKVDVITWSMGSPVSRKAILGGNCTENHRYLGKSITALVDTFITLGGVNYGVEWCPHHLQYNVCNLVNSMNCECQLLEELNSKLERYEGSNSYSLYSFADLIIGHHCCGQICGELIHANQSFELPNYNHLSIMTDTLPIQYDLLNH